MFYEFLYTSNIPADEYYRNWSFLSDLLNTYLYIHLFILYTNTLY